MIEQNTDSAKLQCLSPMYSLGDVWVFSVYQPNYDPSAADGFYCNKTLYTFAFWNAVFETFGFGVLLAKFCKGMLCYVNMSPVDRDFYGNVWGIVKIMYAFIYVKKQMWQHRVLYLRN